MSKPYQDSFPGYVFHGRLEGELLPKAKATRETIEITVRMATAKVARAEMRRIIKLIQGGG